MTILIAFALVQTPSAHAQNASAPAAAQPAPSTPSFFDPKRRQDRPDLPANTIIRFITETDYPPFNYAGPDGNPVGFNVDLARAICEELKVACTIQMRRFDTLADSVADNRADAAIASMAATTDLRRRLDFTDPYYRSAARFASRRDNAHPVITPEALKGKRVAVVDGTAHEAFLKAFFTDAEVKAMANADETRNALKAGDVDFVFGDAVQLAFWLNGESSGNCCAFSGGPFTESRYFGGGIGIAVRRGNDTMRNALNWALFRLWDSGRYSELWLRYFPVSPY
ncbi:polar amino acid transport system substrate-binding protein [Variibacter gotjawalensis]|nr:polar amino acid transport system substrate-binding protein [Variibacter gotjawalensis]